MYAFKAHIIIPMIAFDIIYIIIYYIILCTYVGIYVVKEVNSRELVINVERNIFTS